MNVLNPDRNFTIELNGEIFRGKIPLPSQEIDIDLSVSRRMGGVSLDSFPSATYGYLVAIKTLDYVITDKPNSFNQRYKSFEEVEDSEFVVELYSQYLDRKNKFQEEGKKNRDLKSSQSESRINPQPVPNAEVQYSDQSGHTNNPRPVPVPERVYPGSEFDSGGFHDVPRQDPSVQENSRNREYRPERMDTEAHSQYPGGNGRVHRADDYQRR